MGKSYRRDAKNDHWRKAKQEKSSKSQKHNKPPKNEKSYSPFSDSIEHHESFSGA
jgi:hypothetical protein